MTDKWLKCQVQDGMFTDEKVITIVTVDGREKSYFVPAYETKDDCVKVKVLYNYDSHTCVVLPTEYHDTEMVDFDNVVR